MDALFEAVRTACSRRAWSRGVELVRAEAVSAEREGGPELRICVAGAGATARRVTLSPDPAAWECDCDGEEDPCEHVAAAVIALRRAREAGRALSGTGGAGRLRYRLSRAGDGLALARGIVGGEGETPLTTSLRALLAGRVPAPRTAAGIPVDVLASERDLAVDAALDSPLPGRLSRAALLRLLPLLAHCDDVRLDGAPIRTSGEPLAPQGRLEDAPGGAFRLVVDLLPGVSESLGEGVVRCGDLLLPLRETRLSARELAELPRGRLYPPERAAELVAEVLPDLGKRIPLEIATARLPRSARREPPRIRVATRREGDALAVRADLVYGDPPVAHLEDGRLVAGAGAVPLRDEATERALARRIQAELALPVGAELLVRGEEALALAERLARFEGAVVGGAQAAFFRAPPLAVRLAAGPDGFELDFESEGGARRAEAATVLSAWERGERLLLLPGGGLAPLPVDWLARFGREAAALLEAREAHGRLPTWALPELARFCEAQGVAPPPALAPLRARLEGLEQLPAAALPGDLRAELRSYQRAGVDWLCFLRDAGLGALLADDMGLGKTLQALCALRGRALVVAPTSVLVSWAEEIRRFRPALSVCLFHGAARRLDPAADVTLTSYALLRLDGDTLGAVDWDVAVLDEAQAIKNPDAQAARAAHALRARWRLAMTGTPVENRLDELWSQLHFTNPGLLGTRAGFGERWARPIAAGEPGVAEALQRRLRPFLLRRLKREVAPELPPRTEMVLRCELDAEERAVYDAVRAATRRDVLAKLAAGAQPLAALEALLRLRQAACHRGLVPGQGGAGGSSKLALLLEELEESVAEGHKALVFSQWTSLLDRVEPALRAAGLAWTRLDGSTRDRASVVARFQDEAGPPLLLISLQAGGTGLNLTAADHVFLLDPWWNPAVEDQAADRAHRIGQTRPVMIWRLVATDTVEERVLALQARKRDLATAALGGASGGAPLTREDLLALLD